MVGSPPPPDASEAPEAAPATAASTEQQEQATAADPAAEAHAAAWAAYYAQQAQAQQAQAQQAQAAPTDPAEHARAWAAYYASLGYPGYYDYAAGGGAAASGETGAADGGTAPATGSGTDTSAGAANDVPSADAAADSAGAVGTTYETHTADPAAAAAAAYSAAYNPYANAYAAYGTPSYSAMPAMVPPPAMPAMVPPPRNPEIVRTPGIGPQPGQEEFYRRPDNWPGRGYLVRYVGEAIHRAQETLGNIRHDVLIERRVIGRILGKGGRDLEALQLCTGAEVYIIDKYPPPDEGDDHRLVVIIGRVDQVRSAKMKIDTVLERAREELAPLPPPLASGWRPVPVVGNSDAPAYVPTTGKRERDDDTYEDHQSQRPYHG